LSVTPISPIAVQEYEKELRLTMKEGKLQELEILNEMTFGSKA